MDVYVTNDGYIVQNGGLIIVTPKGEKIIHWSINPDNFNYEGCTGLLASKNNIPKPIK